MSVNPDYVRVNAEREVDDPDSTYNYWASVLRLRKQNIDIFVYGDYVSVDRESEDVFAFVRDGEALVLCNFTDKALEWDPAANGVKNTREVLLSNYEGVGVATQRILGAKWPLRPYEALVVLVNM
jgi:glycosidase